MSTLELPSSSKLTRLYFRSLLFTMIGAIILFALADQSISFLIIGTVGSIIGFWYARQGPSTISRMAINALLSVVVVLGLINALRGNFSVSTFAFFSLLLLILKLFDLRTPRDHGQILVLSLALIIAAALTSNTMPTGIGVVLMGFYFIRALTIFRLYALSTISTKSLNLTSPASTDLRSIQIFTCFICAFFAMLIFLAMPRSLGNNALGQWGGAGSSGTTTGFDDDVELGRPGRITTSTTPVLRLSIKDRNEQPLGNSDSRAIYLRGSVLTEYTSGRWKSHTEQNIPTTFLTRIVKQDQSVPLVNDNTRAEWTQEYELTFIEPDQNFGYLFAPWKPLELKSNIPQARIGVDPDSRMILIASSPVQSYRIRANDPQLIVPDYDDTRPRPTINQDGITPRIQALASQILTRASIDPDPNSRPRQQDAQAVRALETYLRSQFSYTLESEPVPQNQDATEWFLFERQTGHCEYYASALTLMARSIGVPTRVITGYVAAEFNDVSGTYTVRQSNAHAWVEAMIAPDFWRTFDGTPQSDFHDIHEPDPTLFSTIAKFYEAIEHLWVTGVVGYDSDSRSSVFGDINPDMGLESAANTLQERLAAGRFQLIKDALITAGMIFIISMLLGLALIALINFNLAKSILHRARESIASLFARNTDSKIQLTTTRLLNTINTHLDKAGHTRPIGVPLRAHIDNLPIEANPESNLQAGPLNQATDLLYTQQFKPPNSKIAKADYLQSAQSLINTLR